MSKLSPRYEIPVGASPRTIHVPHESLDDQGGRGLSWVELLLGLPLVGSTAEKG